MREGFEVQALTGLLDLSVLDAYEIKVYDGNNLVESSGPEGHTVNAGVLNFDNSRVRLSVNIGSGKQFDHIELWLKGVLGLANTQKIYNVFEYRFVYKIYHRFRKVPSQRHKPCTFSACHNHCLHNSSPYSGIIADGRKFIPFAEKENHIAVFNKNSNENAYQQNP